LRCGNSIQLDTVIDNAAGVDRPLW